MHKFIKLSRDADLEVDYLEQFKSTKKVPQNLFYTSEGALSFYTYRSEDIHQIRWQDELDFFQRQKFWKKSKRIAFISLGCGNAEAEKMFLHAAHRQDMHVDYFGVDSSIEMLNLAEKNLHNEDFDATFILADFTTADFKRTLEEALSSYDVKIFAMIGGTFGNFDQNFIIQTLDNLVSPGSYLYLDVVPQYELDEDNARLHNRLSHLPMNLDLFFKKLLEKLCIPLETGKLVGYKQDEDQVGAVRHTFYFVADEIITFPCFGGHMTVQPGEKLELLNIRAYQPQRLTEYIQRHHYSLQDTYVPDVGLLSHLWQRLLFQKL